MRARQIFYFLSIIVTIGTFAAGYFYPVFLYSFLLTAPLIFIGVRDSFNKTSAIKRNFPVIGHARYILESFRPEIQQYFVETDSEGTPINRINRSLIYQRAKNVNDTMPFGTKEDVYAEGYEWMAHSIYPIDSSKINNDPRILIGGKDCSLPYSSSILNISAMSYGALSNNAVLALNKGAALGNFAHNTGEGGISEYHLSHKGDLIWQVGTGYFGCRTNDGNFNPQMFQERALQPSVKMIELKLSQGAKPGHGGILPAKKNTPEIAAIRGIEPYQAVHSPPYHKAFNNPEGLLNLIDQMRKLSNGKPVGFKLCIGRTSEFDAICQAMITNNIYPDFITIDGGEGGTGAAPVEFSNSLGMPLKEALHYAHTTLERFGIRQEIKLIASGRIFSAFDMAKLFALGADACNSARAMMLALGCIQALQCNTNTCPVGVATQDPQLIKGLDVLDKSQRVYHYHKNTIHAFVELLAAAGLTEPNQISLAHIHRRINNSTLKTYQDIFAGERD